MTTVAVIVAVWFALAFGYGLVLVLMVRKQRERDRILEDAYDRLRGLANGHGLIDAMPSAGESIRSRPRQAEDEFPAKGTPPLPPL